MALAHVGKLEALEILRTYGSKRPVRRGRKETEERPSSVKLPPGTASLTSVHKKYLEDRGFDPDELEKRWHLKGTRNIGPYSFRIIIPIYQNNKLVSFQGRDITGRSPLRYKACPLNREVVPHKECLYGEDYVDSDNVVVVEGVTDVWKLGKGSVATFGIAYKRAQVLRLLQYKNVHIVYDPEPIAQSQAERMAYELSSLGVNVHVVSGLKCDPGDLSADEARDLMRMLR